MVTIYGTANCIYCQKAKQLCEELNLSFVYKPLEEEPHRGEFKQLFPDAKTVPQILLNEQHIGGYNELTAEIENLNLGNYGQGAF